MSATPETLIEKVDALQRVVNALRDGRPVNAAIAAWLAAGIQRYIDEGGNLHDHLGLKVRRGGRFEAPHLQRKLQRRNELLALLVCEVPEATPAARIRRVADFLHGRGPDPVRLGLGSAILESINKLGVGLPEEERLAQIIAGRA